MTETTTTSPAEELREAARLMRDRAYDVARHEDRWTYQERTDVWNEGHVHCDGDPQRSGIADVILGSEAGPHIASWDPTVALAVADWLDATADELDQDHLPIWRDMLDDAGIAQHIEKSKHFGPPFRMARAYLRTAHVEAVSR